MPSTAVYLYGLSRAATAPMVPVMDGLQPERPVTPWCEAAIAAWTSAVDVDWIPAGDDLSAADKARLIELVLRHDAVVSQIAACGAILPVRFGSLFRDSVSLRSFVRGNASVIGAFLDRMTGCDEWSVKSSLATETAFAWLRTHDAELLRRQADWPTSPGARYLAEKRLRPVAEQRLQSWLAATAETLRTELGHDAEAVAHSNGSPFQAAFLVRRERFADWRQRAADWATRLADSGWTLEVTGPWPAYHFVPDLSEQAS